jgi:hypothetical protein
VSIGPVSADLLFAGIPVRDYASGLAWYERLFGRPPDVIVHETEAMWRMTETGWIYVVGDAQRAGRALVTMLVEDLDAHAAELGRRGVPDEAIAWVGERVRKLDVTDPEGNLVSFGETPRADSGG